MRKMSKKEAGEGMPMEERERILSEVNELTEKNVNSWADLYDNLRRSANLYFQKPSERTADQAAATLLAFVDTLERFPEEGDAQVLAKHMNRTLAIEPERIGLGISTKEQHEAAEEKQLGEMRKALEMLVGLGELVQSIQDDKDEMPSSDGRVLH